MEQSKKYGYYIAGFTDGEGSFNASLIKRKDYAEKWKIVASMNYLGAEPTRYQVEDYYNEKPTVSQTLPCKETSRQSL